MDNFNQISECTAHRSRIEIIKLLNAGNPLSVNDIADALGFTQSKASRHVVKLEMAGIIEKKRDDQKFMCSISRDVSDKVKVLLSLIF